MYRHYAFCTNFQSYDVQYGIISARHKCRVQQSEEPGGCATGNTHSQVETSTHFTIHNTHIP